MRIYCMSDMHGHLKEFEDALSLVTDSLSDSDTYLILLGDYIHMGPQSREVIDRIIELQDKYGSDHVTAILGNHEESCIMGLTGVDDSDDLKAGDEKYISWMRGLPRYITRGNTIFTHAGIDEEAGDWWQVGTSDHIFTSKYPAQTGEIPDLDMKVVAGHIGTASISGDPSFHGIFYDGASHYYIDGTVTESGQIPVLMVDTSEDRYYSVSSDGIKEVKAYDKH
ncbi:serine/threonine protein phosphatase 1 [Ruminococcaceae bacterium YRB3002]|nr:serine/threonine protein phosphatase 1 [Ruminococcaceae bacterium YRB3002]